MQISGFPGANLFGVGQVGSPRPTGAPQQAAPAEKVVSDQVGSLPSGYRLVAGELKFEIPTGRNATIGRQPGSDLQLNDTEVSRQHALVQYRDGQVLVCDTGSTNGTYLNGEKLKPQQWHAVRPGATLELGDMKLKLDGPPGAPSPPPARNAAQQGLASGMQAAQAGVGGIAGFVLKNSLGQQFTLNQEGQYSLGRAQDNALIVGDPRVSGHHAMFQLKDGQLAMKDLQSTNGSHVNGQKVAPNEWIMLDPKAQIRLGGTDFQVSSLNPALDLNSKASLEKVIDFRELIVDPQKQLSKYGQIVPDKPNAYWQNNAEARVRIQEYLDQGKGSPAELKACLLEAHKLAVEGSSGDNRYYAGRHGGVMGPDQLPGGEFHEGVIGGVRDAESNLVQGLAQKYGDPYRNSLDGPAPAVKLAGISPDGCPQNMPMHGGQRHFYPSPGHFDEYFTQMQDRLDKLASLPKNASKEEVIKNVAEFYQYGANVRPFRNVNNSLFMNFTNELLSRHGLKPVYHGILDHAAHRLQPDAFNRYFKDWVQGEGQITT